MELFQDLGNRPLIVLRFNPDSYIEENTKIDGIFIPTKSGYSVNNKEWTWRIKELTRAIQHSLNQIPNQELVITRLFYNSLKEKVVTQ